MLSYRLPPSHIVYLCVLRKYHVFGIPKIENGVGPDSTHISDNGSSHGNDKSGSYGRIRC